MNKKTEYTIAESCGLASTRLSMTHPDRTQLVVKVHTARPLASVHEPLRLRRRLRDAVLVCAQRVPVELQEGRRNHLEEILVNGVRGQLTSQPAHA